jgi:hypothetical protein
MCTKEKDQLLASRATVELQNLSCKTSTVPSTGPDRSSKGGALV